MRFKLIIFLLFLVMLASTYSETITYCNSTEKRTNWQKNFSLEKFDSGLGNLSSVKLEFYSSIKSEVFIESTDYLPTSIITQINGSGIFMLKEKNISVKILASKLENVSSFDGIIDFNGSSGRSFVLNASNYSFYNPLNFSDYIASFPGEKFDIFANFSSRWNMFGPGNLAGGVLTNASVKVCVIYDYTNCKDNDNDGVCDYEDKCLGSGQNETVDKDGCDPFQFCKPFYCGFSCYYADFIPIGSLPENTIHPKDCTVVIAAREGKYYPKCVPSVCIN